MNFLDFSSQIKQNKVFPAYLITGEDDYLKNQAVNMLVNFVAQNNEFNKSFFSTENLDEKKFFNVCNSGTFFGDKKIVVLKEFDSQKNNNLLENVKLYLKSPNSCTVFVIVANTEKTVFLNLSNIETIKCDRLSRNDLIEWITSYAQKNGGKISYQTAEMLVDYTNGYLNKIETELNKLLAFKNGEQIKDDDVSLLVKKDLEYSIFELTDSLAQKNTTKALKIVDDLLADRKTAPSILPLIFKFYRRLFYVSVSKMTDQEIADFLNVKEYAVKISRKQVGSFGAKSLKEIIELCEELDYKTKNSELTVENAIHILVFKILNFHK